MDLRDYAPVQAEAEAEAAKLAADQAERQRRDEDLVLLCVALVGVLGLSDVADSEFRWAPIPAAYDYGRVHPYLVVDDANIVLFMARRNHFKPNRFEKLEMVLTIGAVVADKDGGPALTPFRTNGAHPDPVIVRGWGTVQGVLGRESQRMLLMMPPGMPLGTRALGVRPGGPVQVKTSDGWADQ